MRIMVRCGQCRAERRDVPRDVPPDGVCERNGLHLRGRACQAHAPCLNDACGLTGDLRNLRYGLCFTRMLRGERVHIQRILEEARVGDQPGKLAILQPVAQLADGRLRPRELPLHRDQVVLGGRHCCHVPEGRRSRTAGSPARGPAAPDRCHRTLGGVQRGWPAGAGVAIAEIRHVPVDRAE